jgi:type II secretory pathway pseudopilin PulG
MFHPFKKTLAYKKTLAHKNLFSIIEMLTVVFIILLLMSLIAPVFVNLKMSARTSICKTQLRQLGTLMTSYATDNNGFLPYKRANSWYGGDRPGCDIPIPSAAGQNNELYRNWNGHLLPYFDVNLPDNYTRYAMLTKVGTTRWEHNQLGGGPNLPPTNVLKNGWIVVDDAFQKGGYQDLKAFICPEIHQSAFDVAVSNTYNGIRIPRITQLCNEGFWDGKGYTYAMNGGVPTTYLANDLYFGFRDNDNRRNTYRIDEITDVSQKAFLVEGGLANAGGNGESSPPYYMTHSLQAYTGGALTARFDKTQSSIHKLSFVHDNYDKFWIKNGFAKNSFGKYAELASKFNSQFEGKAGMVASGSDSSGGSYSYSLVSYIDPENGKIFEPFFNTNSSLSPIGSWDQFVDDPNDYKYLVGNMNVLFGDNSVSTKDNAWLCNNRQKIADTPY